MNDTDEKQFTSFIGKPEMLEEKVVEMSDPSIFKDAFAKVHGLIKEKQSTFIALVGSAGAGKSTFFHNFVDDVEKTKKIKRCKFDVWEVPGRKYLWDAFVLEFTKGINPDLYEKIKNEIDGESKNWFSRIFNSVNINIPCVGNFSFKEFLLRTSVKRVSEYQDIFREVLNSVKEETIYITLEDIDRSGEEGLYFIETLRKFIDNHGKELGKQFIVLVPLLDKEYEKDDKKHRFKKVFDHILFVDKLGIDPVSIRENILKDILIDDYDKVLFDKFGYQDGIKKIAYALRYVTPRELKDCIRTADSICGNDSRIVFSFIVFLVWLTDNKEEYIQETKDEDNNPIYRVKDNSVFYNFTQISSNDVIRGCNEKELLEAETRISNNYLNTIHTHAAQNTTSYGSEHVQPFLGRGCFMNEPYLSIFRGLL